jgi:ABC-type uncharacterized transport system auxiliary subunit
MRRCGALLLTTLAGCSGFLHSNVQPEQIYFLRATAAPSGEVAQLAVAASLRVVQPFADPGLDSLHIVLVQSNRRMGFYAGSRWPAPVADVVEALAVETLRASGAWKSVEDPTSPFPSDYLLQIAIRRFDADYGSGGPTPEIHVVLECILGTREGRDVIASFVAEGSAVAAANWLNDVVAAFEDAANAALGSLSKHALEAVRAASERKPR